LGKGLAWPRVPHDGHLIRKKPICTATTSTLCLGVKHPSAASADISARPGMARGFFRDAGTDLRGADGRLMADRRLGLALETFCPDPPARSGAGNAT